MSESSKGRWFQRPNFNHMKKLSDIPRLAEAIQYLNESREETKEPTAAEALRKRFGYSLSVAHDVLELWLESANSKNPITFLSE